MQLKHLSYTLMGALLSLSAANVGAYTISNGAYQWEFINSPWADNHDNHGIPDDSLVTNLRNTVYDNAFFRRMSATFPELKNNVNEANQEQKHVTLTADTEVFISFLHESAGYRNSLGYFTYTEDNIPTTRAEISERIVFPNTSYPNRNSTGLSTGDTLSIGTFEAGTSIGFVIVANGFHSSTGVKTNTNEEWILYSIDNLNALDTMINGQAKQNSARYLMKKKKNQIEFRRARPELGESNRNESDTFVIRASAVALPIVAEIKAGKKRAKARLTEEGSAVTNDIGYRTTLVSKNTISSSVAEYTIRVDSVSHSDSMDSVKFTFDDGAIISLPKNRYYAAARESEVDTYITKQSLYWLDNESSSILLTWEDINRNYSYSDHDFNDLVMAIRTSEPGQIAVGDFPELEEPVDSDGDGVTDELDEYPNDIDRAYTNYYPTVDQLGTLAYEDRWPLAADGDINDVVLNYNINEVKNTAGLVKEMNAEFTHRARGGRLATGFAIKLDGISPEMIESAEVSFNGGDFASTIPNSSVEAEEGEAEPTLPVIEAEQSDAVIWVFANSHDYTMPDGNDNEACPFWNTDPDCPNYAANTFDVKVVFTQPLTLPAVPYNPFIFRTFARGYEVHLPNKEPSDKASQDLFGLEDDASEPEQGVYYKNSANMPWGVHIPVIWQYPCEQCNVLRAYPELEGWITSGGTQNLDWYNTNVNMEYLYDK